MQNAMVSTQQSQGQHLSSHQLMALWSITKGSCVDIQHKFVADKEEGGKITMKANSWGTWNCVKILVGCFKGM